MAKNLKWSYILTFILCVIVIAWRTLANFFGGVGINYVAILVVVATLVAISVFDKPTYHRIKDLFIVSCSFAVLETIVYFPFEFGACTNYNVAKVFFVFQNVYAVLGLLFLGWLAFRFVTEAKNIKIGFVETMLGNPNIEKRIKKAKELSNGTLEDKPNQSEEVIIDEFDNYTEEFKDEE